MSQMLDYSKAIGLPRGWLLGTKSEKNSVGKEGGGGAEPTCAAVGKLKWDSG